MLLLRAELFLCSVGKDHWDVTSELAKALSSSLEAYSTLRSYDDRVLVSSLSIGPPWLLMSIERADSRRVFQPQGGRGQLSSTSGSDQKSWRKWSQSQALSAVRTVFKQTG